VFFNHYVGQGSREERKLKTLKYFIEDVPNTLSKPQYILTSLTRKLNIPRIPKMSAPS